MNRLLLGAAIVALGVGTFGSAHAQNQELQPAACTQLEVGQVANRVNEQLQGDRLQQAQLLVQRAREAAQDGERLECRQLLVEVESMLPGGAQVTRTQPTPGFLGGGGDGSQAGQRQEAAIQADNVVAALRQSQQFSTLVGLIESAGLADTLSQGGPYTVFAPTNQAFQQLPQNVRDQLTQQQNQDQLRTVLTQHVVQGQSIASDEIPKQIDPMGGERIVVSMENNRPQLQVSGQQTAGGQGQQQGQQQQAQQQQGQQQGQQAIRDARNAIQAAEQALSGDGGQQQGGGNAQQTAMNQIDQARQALDRALQQPPGNQRQPLEQSRAALTLAEQSLQANDREAARMSLAEARQPLTTGGQQQASQQGGQGQQSGQQRSQIAGGDTATVTVGDIRTRNGYVHGIDTVLLPQGVEQALAQ